MAYTFGAKSVMRLCCHIPLASFDLNIDVAFDAKLTAIFGPSGSGKTTLLDAIAGLRQIQAGEIEIGGSTIFSSAQRIDQPARARGIGYVPQEGALFPHLSVRRNILFGAERASSSQAARAIELDHVVDVLEIAALLNRPVTQLSGGEAQRVALARAILSKPRLLLLDEPLAALDIGLKEKVLPYLARVRDDFSIPMIYVTHSLTEVLTLAEWVLMIRQGKLIAQGVPRDALRSTSALTELSDEQFENVFSATFVESDAKAGSSRVRLASGVELFIPHAPRPADSLCQIRVSSDDILIATQRPAGISATNVLPGTIRRIERLEGESMLTVLAGNEFFVGLTSSAVARLGLVENLPVFLIIKARSFRLL
jgi:molybdate transport system ATP-binding protein